MKNYDYIGRFCDGFAFVRIYNNWGFIDTNYNVICEFKYDAVWYFDNGFAKVRIHSRFGYINMTGVEVVECKYSSTVAHELLKKYKCNQKRILKLKTII